MLSWTQKLWKLWLTILLNVAGESTVLMDIIIMQQCSAQLLKSNGPLGPLETKHGSHVEYIQAIKKFKTKAISITHFKDGTGNYTSLQLKYLWFYHTGGLHMS